jgi:hypothetical protein
MMIKKDVERRRRGGKEGSVIISYARGIRRKRPRSVNILSLSLYFALGSSPPFFFPFL